uniref:Uncharacterized protein n=1 Tax=Rhipicephalus zambeziensis TaxID=60191 RepID=A0A224YHG2_9ACAR
MSKYRLLSLLASTGDGGKPRVINSRVWSRASRSCLAVMIGNTFIHNRRSHNEKIMPFGGCLSKHRRERKNKYTPHIYNECSRGNTILQANSTVAQCLK